MKIYAMIQETGPVTEHALTQMWRDLADLKQTGFITDESTVWLNASYPELGMWVLAERSTHVRVRRATVPGWAVLMRNEVRFGNTVREALAAKESSRYTLDEIPKLTDPTHSTIVVMHNAPNQRLGFRRNSSIVRPVDGQCSNSSFTVIDATLRQRQGIVPGKPTELQRAHAMVSGAQLLTHGMSEEGRAYVHDNLELFAAPFEDPGFNSIRAASAYLESVGETTARLLATNMRRSLYDASGHMIPGAREAGAANLVETYGAAE